MAFHRLLLLFCFVYVRANIAEPQINSLETYDREIGLVLEYLNTSPVEAYIYQNGRLINAQKKANVVELTLEVAVKCSGIWPQIPCEDDTVTCRAFVNSGQLLGQPKCAPKLRVITEDNSDVTTYQLADNPQTSSQKNSIVLSNEDVSSELGTQSDFVAVRNPQITPCLGCPFDLNPNVNGVNDLVNIALKHVESERPDKQSLVKVLRLQQQVVSGVKYILLIEIAKSVCFNECTTEICEIEYIEKPWISTAKQVISNNCTRSQEFLGDLSNNLGNEISVNNAQIKREHPKTTVSPDWLKDLESQVIVDSPETTVPVQYVILSTVPAPSIVYVPSDVTVSEDTPLASEPTTEKNNGKKSSEESSEESLNSSSNDSSSEEKKFKSLKNSSESSEEKSNNNQTVVKPLITSSSEESPEDVTLDISKLYNKKDSRERSKRAIRQLEKITPDEKNVVSNLADFAASALDNIDDDNDKRVILQILGAKKMLVSDGTYYHLILRMGVSYCPEDKVFATNCREKLRDDITKICKVQVHVQHDQSNPKIAKSQCQNIKKDKNARNRTNYGRYRRELLAGGQQGIDKNSSTIQNFILESLAHLDSQDGSQENRLKPIEVLSATSQVVAGALYRIRVKIGVSDCKKNDQKDIATCALLDDQSQICEIKVWEKVWEHYKKFDIDCGDNRTYNFEKTSRKKRQLLGGERDVPTNDTQVFDYLENGLQQLDSASEHPNKYKIEQVIKVTKQVVSGLLYRIKARVVFSDCVKNQVSEDRTKCGTLEGATAKTCNFVIWDQPWLPQGRQINITCDEKNNKKREISDFKHSTKALNYLNRGLDYLDTQSSYPYKLKAEDILTVSKESHDDTYKIKALIVISDCLKSDEQSLRVNCGTLAPEIGEKWNFQPLNCVFKIWKNDFKKSQQTDIECDGNHYSFDSSRDKRQVLVGGVSERNHTDPELKSMIDLLLEQVDAHSNQTNKYKLVEILSATSQVVAGSLHKIRATIVVSDCAKNEQKDRQNCGENPGAQVETCTIEILDQPWIKNGRQNNISCDSSLQLNYRSKRSLLGQDDHDTVYSDFMQFTKDFNKNYESKSEFKYRLKVFTQNMKYARMLNTYERGTARYGPTVFADLSRKEFSQMLGLKQRDSSENAISLPQAKIPKIDLPPEFDWREQKAVTEVKNQGMCGSCWAFSVTGNIEGQYAIKYGNLQEFSEQELVDCDKVDQGCNGGLMDVAYEQIEKLGGLETEKDYPYDGDREKCQLNNTQVVVKVTGALNISQDETEMAQWLVKNGPISIGINANAMQLYVGGVSHPFKFLCNPNNLDHGVLAVGYGVHTYPKFNKTMPYWIVKNSWGPRWGEQGYYRVYRGDGTCGLNQTPTSAIVA